MENPKEIVKDYVSRELADDGQGTDLKEEENLLTNGIMDSLGILKLVTFIEQKFDIHVPDEDVTVQNFRTLKDIANYLENKR
jgi:acyl carrier protein